MLKKIALATALLASLELLMPIRLNWEAQLQL